MKNSFYRIIAAALVLALVVAFAACKKNNGQEAGLPTDAPSYTDVPIITADPEGQVTAGPTATPESFTPAPSNTDVPVITEDPEGNVTAGPTATPESFTPAPSYTDVPIVTADPSANITAGPTATPFTPTAAPTFAPTPAPTPTPYYTNVPIVTANPTANITAGPTATPYDPLPVPTPTPYYTNVPVVTANPTASITAGPTATPYAPTPSPVPTATPTPKPQETPAPTEFVPPAPTPEASNGYTAVYSGAQVDISSLKVGETFYWTLDLSNDYSRTAYCLLLIDYPEEFLTPMDDINSPLPWSWSGGIYSAINMTWDDEEQWSDRAFVSFNPMYEGGTGANPYGAPRNMYQTALMLASGHEYGGIQMSGHIVRFTYRIDRLPTEDQMAHDENGSYLPIRIIVIESKAYDESGETVTHGVLDTNEGRLYFKH